MAGEFALIHALRAIATDPAARALADDAAVLAIGGETLVLTLDTVVESVHYLATDPAADVAWKLVAVNVSDLSAKGAIPLGCLYSHALGEEEWDRAFLEGLDEACRHFAMPLLGGDTVRMPEGAPRSFSLTALGTGPKDCAVPSRTAAKPRDQVWVSGTIGDAGLGLAAALGTLTGPPEHLAALAAHYRRPMPKPRLGAALAPLVHAMMDISDGLLVDTARIAESSGVAIRIEAEAVPLSLALQAVTGGAIEARIAAMTAGDDYELLFTAPPENAVSIRETAEKANCSVAVIGTVDAGGGLTLVHQGKPLPLPERLGYQH
ncbi:thiamine-monophosphate kinase [Novosphingobium barchaimii LL02]|uniref:Thiamine-monophosphate kinase n=1 Tax=Novosphingobium barchaimii LL02 TaxID=1114963 RepID=A0A0J7Y702_9SPHN|nr:thiamine-phosphate kinase [Novosphingobium barchaimii]KMS59601.1 thiamine-monophosphate kinase [Novosphingobium barchaimii LL02]